MDALPQASAEITTRLSFLYGRWGRCVSNAEVDQPELFNLSESGALDQKECLSVFLPT